MIEIKNLGFRQSNTRDEDKIGKRYAVDVIRFKLEHDDKWQIFQDTTYYEREDDGKWYYLYGCWYECDEGQNSLLEEVYRDFRNGIKVWDRGYLSNSVI